RVADDAVHQRQRAVERLVLRVAHVDRERDLARDRVDDVRAHGEAADGRHQVPADLVRDAPHARDDLRRRHERVVTDTHRRGAGGKRAPSSFVKITRVTGRRVRILWSFSARIVSRPQRTPSWPSYLPPVGTESTCEPISTGGSASAPARSPKMFPIWSTVTRRPASRMCATIQ